MNGRWILQVALVALLGCAEEDKKNGEPCDDSEECESGYCQVVGDEEPKCATRCIDNGNACGPSNQANGSCCSGYCGGSGTCELH